MIYWLPPRPDAPLDFTLGLVATDEADLHEIAARIRDSEPQPGRLFGYPAVVEDAGRLPFSEATIDAAIRDCSTRDTS